MMAEGWEMVERKMNEEVERKKKGRDMEEEGGRRMVQELRMMWEELRMMWEEKKRRNKEGWSEEGMREMNFEMMTEDWKLKEEEGRRRKEERSFDFQLGDL